MRELGQYDKNHEGYPDPTAGEAMQNVESEQRAKRLIKIIFELCDVFGFRVNNRIYLEDKRTHKIWK